MDPRILVLIVVVAFLGAAYSQAATITAADSVPLVLCTSDTAVPCFQTLYVGEVTWNTYNYGAAKSSPSEVYGPFTNGANKNLLMTDANGVRILKVGTDLSLTETAHFPGMCSTPFPVGVVGNAAYAVTPAVRSCLCPTNNLNCNKPVLTVDPSNGPAYTIPLLHSSRGIDLFSLATPLTASAVLLDSDPNAASVPFYDDAPINNAGQLDGAAVLISFFQYGMLNQMTANGATLAIWEMSNQWSLPGFYPIELNVDTGSTDTIYCAVLSSDWQTINATLLSGATVSITLDSTVLHDQWSYRAGPPGGLIIASGLDTDTPSFTTDTSLFSVTAGAWLESARGGERNYMWVYAPDGSDVGRIYDMSNGVPTDSIATLVRDPYQTLVDVAIYTHADGRILMGGYQIPSYTDAYVLGYIAATNQFHLIDITDVTNLQVLDSYDLGGDPTFSLASNGAGRFFVGNVSEVLVFDIDANDNIVLSHVLVSGLDAPIVMLSVVGDILYVANSIDGLAVWDLLQEPPTLNTVFDTVTNPASSSDPAHFGTVRVVRGQSNVRELYTVSATQDLAASSTDFQSVRVQSWAVVPPPNVGCIDVNVPAQIALVIATSVTQSVFDCSDLEAALESIGTLQGDWGIYSVNVVDGTLFVSIWASDDAVTAAELDQVKSALGAYLGSTDGTNIAYGRNGVQGQKTAAIVAKTESSASVLACCFLLAALLAALLL